MKVIKITYDKLKKRVLAELTFIGKRQQNVKGDPLFSTSTFSSAEGLVVESAITSAASVIVKELKEYTIGYCTIKDDASTDKITGIEFTIENIRNDEDMQEALEQTICSFIISYSTAVVLARITPDLAKTFYDEANTLLLSLVSLAINKRPVDNPLYSINDMKGSVALEDGDNIIEI